MKFSQCANDDGGAGRDTFVVVLRSQMVLFSTNSVLVVTADQPLN